MLKKKAGFFMIITGCLLAIALTVFTFFFIIIKKLSIGSDAFLLYLLFLVPTMLIGFGYGILDEAEKNNKTE